jgi:hypothetical protein
MHYLNHTIAGVKPTGAAGGAAVNVAPPASPAAAPVLTALRFVSTLKTPDDVTPERPGPESIPCRSLKTEPE